jgi:tRNA 2-thiouridine synthesizing protein A
MTVLTPRRLDARGLACPMPILKTARAIAEMEPGELLEVLATDPGSIRDFDAWSRTTGHELIERTQEAGVYRFLLRRK